MQEVDTPIEPQPLWEYPCRSLGPEKIVLEIDLKTLLENNLRSKETIIEIQGSFDKVNGISLWAEWAFGDYTISTGPVVETIIGKRV